MFSFLLTILMAYIVGLCIVHLVDRKLEQITIKLPEKWNADRKETPHFLSWEIENKKKVEEQQQQTNLNNNLVLMENYQNQNDIKKCSYDIGYNNVEPEKDSYYMYKPINYPHPKTMSQGDLMVYKAKYHPRMTPQDYYNWLMMFVNSPEELKKIDKSGIHAQNLEIAKKNGILTVPQYVPESILIEGNSGTRYPHLSCPFMSYDINKLVGYNFGKYSEFV